MKIATIDIGTNTILLLVATVGQSGNIVTLAYEQRIPRLGRGVDAYMNLQPESMHRAIDVMKEYENIIEAHQPDSVVVAATSAVRDAANRNEFSNLLRVNTGFELEVLSGDDEAYWTYRGAISGIANIGHATVVDIGGGSTEITVGDRVSIHNRISLGIGSVRVTERFFKNDPPTHPELEAAITFVEDELARPKGFGFSGSTLIGVAGTATSLAMLDQELKEFSVSAVTGYRMKLDNVYSLFRMLREMPSTEIRKLSEVM
ncbi:MAG: Ppx/GppA family phosphatase, partial [Ignavibacteriae bacterium]|nr:Ppx/GppA family phosphatase [Ignavibacteriota bacterium]